MICEKNTARMSKPWIQQKIGSATSLNRLGLEKAVAPVQDVKLPANGYERKELPPIPSTSDHGNLRRTLSDQSPGNYDSKGRSILYSQHDSRLGGTSRPAGGCKGHSLPESASKLDSYIRQRSGDGPKKAFPPPPPPPMTKSAQKILQLTGFDISGDSSRNVLPPPPPPPMSKSAQKILQLTDFDPSFDQEPSSHYSVSPESSDAEDSSGSHYSQPEDEPQEYVLPGYHWAATLASAPGEPSVAYLQPSFYSASESSGSISDRSVAAAVPACVSATSLRVKGCPMKQSQQEVELIGEYSADNLTNEEFIAIEKAHHAKQARARFKDRFEREDRRRYRDELTDKIDVVPKSHAIRSKSRVDDENIYLEKYHTNLHSPTGLPYDGMPVHSRIPCPPANRLRHKRRFGTVTHPMKSPFSFTGEKDTEGGESEQRFKKKISGAMRRLSGLKNPPENKTVIPNKEREAGGTDPPVSPAFKAFFPSQEAIQKGNDHLQGTVDKAKKSLKIKTDDEKRREELKKQIVVVGIIDQSPGNYSLLLLRHRKLTILRWEGF